ncbi:MAG: hypothetical protein Q8L48_27855 [Archangium sp.]|nr:hypothetical protein [Archangium sp.]
MRAWVVMGMVGLAGCRQPADRFEASADIRCEVGEPVLPKTFPIAPDDQVFPTADGFVFGTHRWRFAGDGLLRREGLAAPLTSAASLDGVTAVADSAHVELWEGDRRVPCASATGRITSVGMTRDDVLWVEVASSSSTLFRAARTAGGCGPAQVMTTQQARLFRPTRLGAEWVVAAGGQLLVLNANTQGVVRRWQLPRHELLELCGGPDGLLFATNLGLFRQGPDGTQTELQRFPERYGVASCEGEAMTVSFSSASGAVFERYATSGELLERRASARVGASGLAGGGWKQDTFVVLSWDDRILETADPALVDRVWSHGATASVSMGPGPLLRWREGSWQRPGPEETWLHLEAVPDGRRGVTLLGSPGPFELWAGEQLLQKRHWLHFGEVPSTVRGWVVDPCSDRALVELEVTGQSTLFARTGDDWREVAVPRGALLAASLEGDDLVVRMNVDRQLRQPIAGGDWVEEPAAVVLSAAPSRILPLDSAIAAQTPSGVEVLRPGSQPSFVHTGARLVGTAGRYVIVATGRGLATFDSSP